MFDTLPESLLRHIYEYDGTKRENMDKLLRELKVVYRVLARLYWACYLNAVQTPTLKHLKRIARSHKKADLKHVFHFLRKTGVVMIRMPKHVTKTRLVMMMFIEVYPSNALPLFYHAEDDLFV